MNFFIHTVIPLFTSLGQFAIFTLSLTTAIQQFRMKRRIREIQEHALQNSNVTLQVLEKVNGNTAALLDKIPSARTDKGRSTDVQNVHLISPE